MNKNKQKKLIQVTIKEYYRMRKRITKFNAKHHPLESVPDKNRNVGDSFVTYGGRDDTPIGLGEGMEGHGAVFGGSGSGKSASFAILTLQTWKGAVVATDVKGELSDWYKFYKHKKLVKRPEIVFDPEDDNCPCYDPFFLIDKYPDDKMAIISSIARTLIPDPKEDGLENTNSFWTKSAQNFLKAALLFLYNLNMSFIEAVIVLQTTKIKELCDKIENSDEEANAIISKDIYKNPNLLSSIDVDVHNALVVFSDPYIAKAFDRTSGSRNGVLTWEKVDTYNIFLKLPIEKMKNWKSAFNIMYSQLIFSLNKRRDRYSYGGENNVQTLLLMDEFANLGRIVDFEVDISTLRSKNVNIFIILQSIAQLDKLYGVNGRKEIMDNCSQKIIFRCDDSDSRRYFSELIGTHEELKVSLSRPLGKSQDINTMSVLVEERRVNTVEPQELGTLECVIVISDGHPFRLQKISMSDEYRLDYRGFTAHTSKAEMSTCDNSDIQEKPQLAFSASFEEMPNSADAVKMLQEFCDMMKED